MDWKEKIRTGLTNWIQQCSVDDKFQTIESQLIDLRSDIEDERTILIAGEFNAGKSTFINALLGEKILSSDVTPETAMVTKLTYGEQRKTIAHYLTGGSEVFNNEWFVQLTAEREGEFKNIRHQLSHVELQVPSELLRKLTIIDTPGLNANNEYHTNATERFLARADYAIFLFHAMNVGTATEIKWLKKFNEMGIQPFGVINRIDELDEEEDDLESLIDFNKPRIGPAVQGLVGVSARDALDGKLQKNDQILQWSNWEVIERLLTSVEAHPNRKLERVYSRLIQPLQELDELSLNWKFSLPLKKFDKAKVEDFLSEDYQALLFQKEKVEKQQTNSRLVHSKWESFLDTSIYTLDGLNKFFLGFVEHYGGSQHQTASSLPANFLAVWDEKVMVRYQTFSKDRKGYNDKVKDLVEDREKLIQKWKAIQISNFLTKKGKLEKQQRKLDFFHTERTGLAKKNAQLTTQFAQMNKSLKDSQNLVTSCIKGDLHVQTEKERLEVNEWNKKLKTIQGVFSTITMSDVDQLNAFSEWNDDFLNKVAISLLEPGQMLENDLGYEEVRYRIRNIVQLSQDLPSNEFYTKWSEMNLLEKESVGDYDLTFPPLTPPELQSHELKEIPNLLKQDIQGAIQAVTEKRNQWVKRGIATVIVSSTIGGIVYANQPTDYSHEDISDYEVYSEDESSIDYLEDDISEEQILEEEKLELERQFPREGVAGLLADVKYELGQYSFDPDDHFTSEGWESFSPYHEHLSSGDSWTMDLDSVEYLSRTDLKATVKESFVQSGILKEFDTTYSITLDTYGYFISDFTYTLSNETEVEIGLEEGEIHRFLSEFHQYYMGALNETDESYISDFFEPNSTAPEQLITYIHSIDGKGYLYEDAQLQVDTVTKIGTNEYRVTTTEQFMLTDDKEELTSNLRNKEYVIKNTADSGLVITSIQTTESQQEIVIIPTVHLVSTQGIHNFFQQYYTSFQLAFNGSGFDYVSSFYDSNQAAYRDAEAYIENANSKNMEMSNLYLSVESISEIDENHYEVTVNFEDEYSYQDGTGDQKKVQAVYRIRVTEDARLLITDNLGIDVLEEIELQEETS